MKSPRFTDFKLVRRDGTGNPSTLSTATPVSIAEVEAQPHNKNYRVAAVSVWLPVERVEWLEGGR